MTALIHFVVTLLLCTAAGPALARARWTWRSPTLGVIIWQLVALTWVLCLVGALLAAGLEPYQRRLPTAFAAAVDELPAGRAPDGFTAAHAALLVTAAITTVVVLGAALVSWVAATSKRRRHRALLDILAHHDPGLPGVLLLDHPTVSAYCVPGLRPRVVVTTGARRALTPGALAAVLAHERAHARERHDLALLPFSALRRLNPRHHQLRAVFDAVALLLEMRADDVARRHHHATQLGAALTLFQRLGGSHPAATLGIDDGSITARLERITHARPDMPATARWLILTTAAVLASTPISFFLLP